MKNTNTTTIERGNEMAFDKVKYIDEWNKENREVIRFKVVKGKKQELEELARNQGKSPTRLIKDALYYYMDALGVDRIDLG